MNATPLEAGAEHAARNKLVINLLLVSAFVVILNETIMSVAIPPLMSSLGVTAAAAQWVTTAFLLTMAVVIPMTGFLLQRLHTRAIFILAMSLFSLGTLAAALAPGLELLVVARVIQASGTAIMMPLLMTTVMTLVPPETRGKTMGNIMMVISVAPADRSGAVGADPELLALALVVRARAADRARFAVARLASHRERHDAARRPARHPFGDPLGVRVRRLRIRLEPARRAAGAGSTAGVGSAGRRRHRDDRVRAAAAQAAADELRVSSICACSPRGISRSRC